MDYLHLILHVASIFASVAAGFLWMRSAMVKVPPLSPAHAGDLIEHREIARWLRDVSENLDLRANCMSQATRLNMAAAAAASIAALAQATVFVLNLVSSFI